LGSKFQPHLPLRALPLPSPKQIIGMCHKKEK